MLRLAIAIVIALGSTAEALVVIDEPPIVEACGHGKTWSDIDVCLKRQGAITVERVLPKAKLVRVVQTENKKPYDLGVYLYVQRPDGAWSVGGMFSGASYSVLELAPLVIDSHAGYRLVVGQLVRTRISIGGATSLPVILQTQRTLFCAGDRYGCADATTHCDVIYAARRCGRFGARSPTRRAWFAMSAIAAAAAGCAYRRNAWFSAGR